MLPAPWLLAASLGASTPVSTEPARGQIESISPLVHEASGMARGWSADAVLYSVLGTAPRNEDSYLAETWSLVFGDPKTKDGTFEAAFKNSALESRQGIKGPVRYIEFFKDGKVESTRASPVHPGELGYKNCRPLAPGFLDTPALEDRIRELKILPEENGQYRLSLLRPTNDACDGLGRFGLFLPEKPIPRELLGRTLWVVTGVEETVFLNAVTGKLLGRRRKGHPTQEKPKQRPRLPKMRLRR